MRFPEGFSGKNPQVGSLVVIQRFGGAINFNMHFHSLFMAGVFCEEEEKFIVCKINIRFNRSLQKKGFLNTP